MPRPPAASRPSKSSKAVKPAKAKAAAAKPVPCRYSIDEKAGTVTCKLSVPQETLEAILGAAYLLTDRAYARLDGDRERSVTVTLRPKAAAGLKELAETFVAELETQKVRWAIARNNLPIREFVAEQAVLLANGKLPAEPAPAAPPADELSADQRLEIEKLIAEVEAEIKTLNDKKAPADPKKIAASWEEKQQPAKGTEKA